MQIYYTVELGTAAEGKSHKKRFFSFHWKNARVTLRQGRIKILEALVHSEKMRPPKIQLGVWGSAVSSPSVVWGRVPAEIEFGVL